MLPAAGILDARATPETCGTVEIKEPAAAAASGLFFNFNGTAGILRRSMIHDAGGWQHDTLTEDLDLSYRAQLNGWRFIFLADTR